MHRYSKIKLLGQGGFGSATLVSAKDDPKRLYVVKEVRLSGDMKAAEEAKREAQFLKALHHPNIVGYIESFVDGPSPGLPPGNAGSRLAIIMEYADGGDLHARISALKKGSGGGMSEDEALSYFVQICLALKHMHDRRILHRDLKSQNVFLTKKGVVKVGDLGIAKALSSSIDMAKTQIGTPYYLSPEICCDRPYNKKSDMWALGVLLYEMLALTLPFTASDLPRLVTKILAGSYPPLPMRYTTGVRSLVESLLQKDPKARPSVGQLLRSELLQARISKFLTQTLAAREFGEALRVDNPAHAELQPLIPVQKPASVEERAAVALKSAAQVPRGPSPAPAVSSAAAQAPAQADALRRQADATRVALERAAAERAALATASAKRKADAEALAAAEARKRALLDVVARERSLQREREAEEAAALAELARARKVQKEREREREKEREKERLARVRAAVPAGRGGGDLAGGNLAGESIYGEERRKRRDAAMGAKAAWIAARAAEREQGWVSVVHPEPASGRAVVQEDVGRGMEHREKVEGGGGSQAGDAPGVAEIGRRAHEQVEGRRAGGGVAIAGQNLHHPSPVASFAHVISIDEAASAAAAAYAARQRAERNDFGAGNGAGVIAQEALKAHDAYLDRLEAGRKAAYADRQAAAARAQLERQRESSLETRARAAAAVYGEDVSVSGPSHEYEDVRAAARARREAELAGQEARLREAARAAVVERRALEARARAIEDQLGTEGGSDARAPFPDIRLSQSTPGSAGPEAIVSGEARILSQRAAAAASEASRLAELESAGREAWEARKALKAKVAASAAAQDNVAAGASEGGKEHAPSIYITVASPHRRTKSAGSAVEEGAVEDASVVIFSPGGSNEAKRSGLLAWRPPPLRRAGVGGHGDTPATGTASGIASRSPSPATVATAACHSLGPTPSIESVGSHTRSLSTPSPAPLHKLEAGQGQAALGPLQIAMLQRRSQGQGLMQGKVGVSHSHPIARAPAANSHANKQTHVAVSRGSSAGSTQAPKLTRLGPASVARAALPVMKRPVQTQDQYAINSSKARAAMAAIDVAVADALRLRSEVVMRGGPNRGREREGESRSSLPTALALDAEDEAAVALEVDVQAMQEQMQAMLGRGPRGSRSRRPTVQALTLAPVLEEETEEHGERESIAEPESEEEDTDSEDEDDDVEGREKDDVDENDAAASSRLYRRPSRLGHSYTGMPNMATILAALAQADEEGYGPGMEMDDDARNRAAESWAAPLNADSEEDEAEAGSCGKRAPSPGSTLLLSTTLRPAQLRAEGMQPHFPSSVPGPIGGEEEEEDDDEGVVAAYRPLQLPGLRPGAGKGQATPHRHLPPPAYATLAIGLDHEQDESRVV